MNYDNGETKELHIVKTTHICIKHVTNFHLKLDIIKIYHIYIYIITHILNMKNFTFF